MYKKIGELLNKSYQNKSLFDFFTLGQKWDVIVGPTYAEHSIPIKIVSQTLHIITDHSMYSQQLSFLQSDILDKIFKIYPDLRYEIKRLNFKHNSKFFREKKDSLIKNGSLKVKKDSINNPKMHPENPIYKKLLKEAHKQFDYIKDLDLKEKMISIFIQQHI